MSLSVGRLRRASTCLASFAALGVLAFALLEPALAGAPETPPASSPPAAAMPAPPPSSAEKPQAPAPGAAETHGAAKTPETPAAAPIPGVETKPPVTIVYLGKHYDEPLPLSYAEKPIFDKGIQGARLIIKEANQAGHFVGNSFQLVEAIIPPDGDIVAKAKEILAKGDAFIIADLEPKDLLAVADLPEAKNSILVNIRASDDSLRQEQCRSNVFHIIPSYAMRADALAQYLIWKKWPRWFVVHG